MTCENTFCTSNDVIVIGVTFFIIVVAVDVHNTSVLVW